MMRGISLGFIVASAVSGFLSVFYFVRYLEFPPVSSWSASTNFANAAMAGMLVQYHGSWIDFRELQYFQTLIPSATMFGEIAVGLALAAFIVYPLRNGSVVSRVLFSQPNLAKLPIIAIALASAFVMVFCWLLDFLPGVGWWNTACMSLGIGPSCAGSEIIGDTAFGSFAVLIVCCALLQGGTFWKSVLKSVGLVGAPILVGFEMLIFTYLPMYFWVNATDFLSHLFSFTLDPITLSTWAKPLSFSGYVITNSQVMIASALILTGSLVNLRLSMTKARLK